MDIEFVSVTQDDAEFILEIRNHPDTIKYLHTRDEYTVDEFKKWHEETSPEWLLIVDKDIDKPVGYVRTSERTDYELMVGIDIHIDYRRQGYATAAYKKLFYILKAKMYQAVNLEVFDYNPAFEIYKHLGFESVSSDETELGTSTSMTKELTELTGKGVKVISLWFGDRRREGRGTKDPNETLQMLKYWWSKEKELDYGYPMDILLVHPMPLAGDNIGSREDYVACLKYVQELHGESTVNGKVMVHHRFNIGLSFGSFDFAFKEFCDDYDYWLFCEDDQIIIKDGILSESIEMLKRINMKSVSGGPLGFVATVGAVDDVMGWHAHGACGTTTREILKLVWDSNYSEILGRGHLPYYHTEERGANRNHETHGEIRFTNEIVKLGFGLSTILQTKFLVGWMEERQRYPRRFISWSEDMISNSENNNKRISHDI